MSDWVDRIVANIVRLEVRLLACQARLQAETDPEALHDLRTTVRRLRSLLRPLRGLPGVVQLEMAASQVGALTTPLRDLEVLAAYLRQQGYVQLAERRLSQLAGSYGAVAESAQLAQLLLILDPGTLAEGLLYVDAIDPSGVVPLYTDMADGTTEQYIDQTGA